MNRPALLVLVRHGQSERNVVKKCNHFVRHHLFIRERHGVKDMSERNGASSEVASE